MKTRKSCSKWKLELTLFKKQYYGGDSRSCRTALARSSNSSIGQPLALKGLHRTITSFILLSVSSSSTFTNTNYSRIMTSLEEDTDERWKLEELRQNDKIKKDYSKSISCRRVFHKQTAKPSVYMGTCVVTRHFTPTSIADLVCVSNDFVGPIRVYTDCLPIYRLP